MIKFSVVIPVYKAERYLRECLDSLVAQTYRDWQCICIDDGSPDGSGAILDEYATRDERFSVIHQPNAGVSAARNAGIVAATGEWICFVDADDTVEADWLANYASVVSPQVQLVFSGVKYAGRKMIDYTATEKMIPLTGELIAARRLLQLNFCFSRIYQAKFLKENGILFPEGIPFSEDMIFNYRALRQAAAVAFVNGMRYLYRRVEGSASMRIHPWNRYLETGRLAVAELEGPNGVFARFNVPEGYRQRVLAIAYVGHRNYAVLSALRNRESNGVIRSLLAETRSRPELIRRHVRKCRLLRRIWACFYLRLPIGILLFAVRTCPKLLISI